MPPPPHTQNQGFILPYSSEVKSIIAEIKAAGTWNSQSHHTHGSWEKWMSVCQLGLVSLLIHSSGSKPREWYCPLLGWIFPHKLKPNKTASDEHAHRATAFSSQGDPRLCQVDTSKWPLGNISISKNTWKSIGFTGDSHHDRNREANILCM